MWACFPGAASRGAFFLRRGWPRSKFSFPEYAATFAQAQDMVQCCHVWTVKAGRRSHCFVGWLGCGDVRWHSRTVFRHGAIDVADQLRRQIGTYVSSLCVVAPMFEADGGTPFQQHFTPIADTVLTPNQGLS